MGFHIARSVIFWNPNIRVIRGLYCTYPLLIEWIDKVHPTLYNGCNYLSMLGLKLDHVSERGPRC